MYINVWLDMKLLSVTARKVHSVDCAWLGVKWYSHGRKH
jgi:hypothetical protein